MSGAAIRRWRWRLCLGGYSLSGNPLGALHTTCTVHTHPAQGAFYTFLPGAVTPAPAAESYAAALRRSRNNTTVAGGSSRTHPATDTPRAGFPLFRPYAAEYDSDYEREMHRDVQGREMHRDEQERDWADELWGPDEGADARYDDVDQAMHTPRPPWSTSTSPMPATSATGGVGEAAAQTGRGGGGRPGDEMHPAAVRTPRRRRTLRTPGSVARYFGDADPSPTGAGTAASSSTAAGVGGDGASSSGPASTSSSSAGPAAASPAASHDVDAPSTPSPFAYAPPMEGLALSGEGVGVEQLGEGRDSAAEYQQRAEALLGRMRAAQAALGLEGIEGTEARPTPADSASDADADDQQRRGTLLGLMRAAAAEARAALGVEATDGPAPTQTNDARTMSDTRTAELPPTPASVAAASPPFPPARAVIQLRSRRPSST
ncbi:hypothetical protein B0H10DRAFT_483147 [Mycena sp. CBHHK59/15]|nr:hypothetical protein B0H10DRAFT_483147 [Mycena sp. CBHHK59/15]